MILTRCGIARDRAVLSFAEQHGNDGFSSMLDRPASQQAQNLILAFQMYDRQLGRKKPFFV